MYALSLLSLIALTGVAFVPVLRLSHHRHYETFAPLRALVSVVFLWSCLTMVKYIVADYLPVLGYYLHLVSYAIVLLIAMNFYNTILRFIGKPLTTSVKVLGYLYFTVFTLLLLLNDALHLVVVEGSETLSSLKDVLNVNVTPLFHIHVLIVYLLMGIPIAKLLIYLRTRGKSELYKVPFRFFLSGVLIGLVFNGIHLFVHTFFLDPTLVVIVLFSYLLFYLIYHRDMGFILITEGRKTLIENMREMYIVTDETGKVIDLSKELENRFKIDQKAHVETIMDALKEKAVLYEDIDNLKDKSRPLPYLYTIEKPLEFKKTAHIGKLYLFYDESRFVRIMQKLEYLQSHDAMTGLYNRNYFEQQLPTLQKTYDQAVILIADINGLKLFNDHFGHKEGDKLILRFADVLRSTTQTQEDIYRMRIGGDEFLVFLGNASKEDAEALKSAIMRATHHKDPLKRISTSIGYAVRKKNETLETTFLRADHALYTMKKATSQSYKEAFEKAYKKRYAPK